MELTLDIGSNVYEDLEKASSMENRKIDVMAAEMLSLGLKVFFSSKENEIDLTTKILLENSLRANELLLEMIHLVFDKDKSNIGAYDAETAIAFIDRIVKKIMERAE